MPGERSDFCADCGTAPCSHVEASPCGVDLIAVIAIVLIAVAVGLLIGYHMTSWSLG